MQPTSLFSSKNALKQKLIHNQNPNTIPSLKNEKKFENNIPSIEIYQNSNNNAYMKNEEAPTSATGHCELNQNNFFKAKREAALERVKNSFEFSNLYEILEVESSADEKKIKQAYKKATLKVHPDKGGKNNEEFFKVSLAYKILGNKEIRKIYDEFGLKEAQIALNFEGGEVVMT